MIRDVFLPFKDWISSRNEYACHFFHVPKHHLPYFQLCLSTIPDQFEGPLANHLIEMNNVMPLTEKIMGFFQDFPLDYFEKARFVPVHLFKLVKGKWPMKHFHKQNVSQLVELLYGKGAIHIIVSDNPWTFPLMNYELCSLYLSSRMVQKLMENWRSCNVKQSEC